MFDTPLHARSGTSLSGDSPLPFDAGIGIDADAQRWMLLIQGREQSGLRSLHAAFEPRVFRCAIGIVRHDEIAQEVVSTSFMQAWTTAASYDRRRGTVVAWLLLIARSRSLDALRRARHLRQHEVSSDDDDDPVLQGIAADRELEPLSRLERGHRQRRLERALSRLSPMQRQVVSLTTMGGLSHDEASRCLGIPLGTVKSHAKRGLAALRERCEAIGWTGD